MAENLDRMGTADLHELQGAVDAIHELLQFIKHLSHTKAPFTANDKVLFTAFILQSLSDDIRLAQGNARVVARHLAVEKDRNILVRESLPRSV